MYGRSQQRQEQRHAREADVEKRHGGKEKDERGEEHRAHQQLFDVVVARVDALLERIVLAAAKQIPKRRQHRPLRAIQPRGKQKEAANVQREQIDQVDQQRQLQRETQRTDTHHNEEGDRQKHVEKRAQRHQQLPPVEKGDKQRTEKTGKRMVQFEPSRPTPKQAS